MPTPQREPLRKLSRSERTALERIGRRNNERVDVVRRANALLAVARTGVFIHAAHEAVRNAEINVMNAGQKTGFKAIQDVANPPQATRDAQRMGLVPGGDGSQPSLLKPFPGPWPDGWLPKGLWQANPPMANAPGPRPQGQQ